MNNIKTSSGKILVRIENAIVPVTGVSLSELSRIIAKKKNIKKMTVLGILSRYLSSGKMPKPGTLSHICITEMKKIIEREIPENEN